MRGGPPGFSYLWVYGGGIGRNKIPRGQGELMVCYHIGFFTSLHHF